MTGAEGSTDVERLRDESDALLLATGATVLQELPFEGRDLPSAHFAMALLTDSIKALLDGGTPALSAESKDVIVIGGGDTRTVCIGTSLRQFSRSLTNFELFPKPPAERTPDNPWPTWQCIFRVDYGHEESARKLGYDPRVYSISSKSFMAGGDGMLAGFAPRRWRSRMAASRRSPVPSKTGRRIWCADHGLPGAGAGGLGSAGHRI